MESLLKSFELFLRAEGKSPKTIETYRDGVRSLIRFLDGDKPTREAIIRYREHLSLTKSPATAANRHRSLKAFFKWAEQEGELVDPMHGLRVPRSPEQPPDILTNTDLKKLLEACRGINFIDKRDEAILRLFIDTGMRRAEVSALTVEDIDTDAAIVVCTGKGGRRRVVPIGPQTQRSLDRYLRVRAKHRCRHLDNLWLGKTGALSYSGLYQAVRERALKAGVTMHPHLLRHTFAHRWLSAGGQEGDLMQVAGWRNRAMLSRYGASAAAQRAVSASRKLHLDDV